MAVRSSSGKCHRLLDLVGHGQVPGVMFDVVAGRGRLPDGALLSTLRADSERSTSTARLWPWS